MANYFIYKGLFTWYKYAQSISMAFEVTIITLLLIYC